jgi:hypothetical protein
MLITVLLPIETSKKVPDLLFNNRSGAFFVYQDFRKLFHLSELDWPVTVIAAHFIAGDSEYIVNPSLTDPVDE